MSRVRRLILWAGLVAGVFLLGGCVYLRLWQLKLQLAQFDKNFAVETHQGLALTFNHPVLLDEDVKGFFHWVPDSRQRIGQAEKWHFAWTKNRAEGDSDSPLVQIDFDLFFADRKLVKIVAPETFFAATMPKSLALAALRSLGKASVNREKRSANSTIDPKDLEAAASDQFLTEQGLLTALGEPTSRATREATVQWRYQFTPVSTRQRFGENGNVDVTFTLDAVTRRVRQMQGRTVFGAVSFDTDKTGESGGSVQATLHD